jgi:hypothetical protein
MISESKSLAAVINNSGSLLTDFTTDPRPEKKVIRLLLPGSGFY